MECRPWKHRRIHDWLSEVTPLMVTTSSPGDLNYGFGESSYHDWRMSGGLWARIQPSRSVVRQWQEAVLNTPMSCDCGKPAKQLGHVVPKSCFIYSGYHPDASYYRENIKPVCAACNGAWLDYHHRDWMAQKWPRRRVNRWYRWLDRSLACARAQGISVHLHPSPPVDGHWKGENGGWLGIPVVARPEDPTIRELEVIGILKATFGMVFSYLSGFPYLRPEAIPFPPPKGYEFTPRGLRVLRAFHDRYREAIAGLPPERPKREYVKYVAEHFLQGGQGPVRIR